MGITTQTAVKLNRFSFQSGFFCCTPFFTSQFQMRKCHTRIIRCVWICLNEQCAVVGCLLLFSIFAITFAPPCPLSLGHMLCHATTWCDVCLFFSSHLQWMSSYDSIWIEHRKTQQKNYGYATCVVSNATTKKMKWESEKCARCAQAIVSYELDWLTGAEKK